MNNINNNLYVSNAQAVRSLPDHHQFDEVVTLGYYDQFSYSRPNASTTDDRFVFPDSEHDYNLFVGAVEYILDALDNDKSVLVHCQAGCSRSPSVCMAVLTEYEDLSIDEAFCAVANAREQTNPTDPLIASLERYVGESLK